MPFLSVRDKKDFFFVGYQIMRLRILCSGNESFQGGFKYMRFNFGRFNFIGFFFLKKFDVDLSHSLLGFEESYST